MAKIISFFENSPDNVHCLQSCMKSLLSFYFPNEIFTNEDIDTNTIQTGGWSWLPPSAVWLYELGLNVKLYSPFNYQRFANEGEIYIKEFKGEELFENEERNGAYENMPLIQQASQEMVTRGLWEDRFLSKEELEFSLENESTFAVGKTVYEWLDGNSEGITSHYVLVIKKYAPGVWKVHDPGLPGKEGRKIDQQISGSNIFGDVLLVTGLL